MVSSLQEQWSFLGKLEVQYLLIAEKAIGDVGTGVPRRQGSTGMRHIGISSLRQKGAWDQQNLFLELPFLAAPLPVFHRG